MTAERGMGFRAELVEPAVAAAIAISLTMSIATAVGRPPVRMVNSMERDSSAVLRERTSVDTGRPQHPSGTKQVEERGKVARLAIPQSQVLETVINNLGCLATV